MSVATPSALDVVRRFLGSVRSGMDLARVHELMAPTVRAHQVVSEALGQTVTRTPADYAAHVEEMRQAFGPFELTVDELFQSETGDKVYVRWTQRGHHLASIDGEPPTGAPLVEVASAVYRVADGRIVEYWIQVDRQGLRLQLGRAPRSVL